MANIKHLVIVMMENRSFDEYFGTFPGVSGFFDQSPAFAPTMGDQPAISPLPSLPMANEYIYHQRSGYPGGAHQWNSMHQAVNPQLAISGLNYPQGANNMGFYIAQGWGQPWSQSGAVMAILRRRRHPLPLGRWQPIFCPLRSIFLLRLVRNGSESYVCRGGDNPSC